MAGANGAAADDATLTAASMETLALPLLAGTQAAALAAMEWIGRGDKEAADHAAVAAMRESYQHLRADAVVLIGEGEKDDAPMLHVGERLGTGGPRVEIAVDPLEGTSFCASGGVGAISIVACAPGGALWGAPAAYYMDKVVVGPEAVGVIDIDAPVAANLAAVAKASGKRISELVAVILSKPRHEDLIREVRRAGARVVEVADGDIAGAFNVLLPSGRADLLLGIGGAPEGVITACAVQLLGGDMVARLAPQSDDEAARLHAAGVDEREVLTVERLAGDGVSLVAATGVTGGILQAPMPMHDGWETESLLMTPAHPALIVRAHHLTAEVHRFGRTSPRWVSAQAPRDPAAVAGADRLAG